jgi:hypothetical protein
MPNDLKETTLTPDPTGELAWLQTSDGLLRGLIHGLNNRVAALSAIVQVMAGRGASGVGLEETVLEEIQRLSGVIELMRLVPRRRGEPAEPISVADLLPELTEALSLHSELGDVTFETEIARDLLPVYCPPTSLAHSLCILLFAAGSSVRQPATVRVTCGSSPAEVLVQIAAEGSPAGRQGAHGVDPKGAEALLGGSEGKVSVAATGDQGQRIELRLPTLLEARRLGEEARSS